MRSKATAILVGLLLAKAGLASAQNALTAPLLDSAAACRRAQPSDDCMSKERSAETAVHELWAAAREDRRAACVIYILIGPPHGYADLQNCLGGTADLAAMTDYLRTAQERHYKYRYFYFPPDVAVPVESLGDCLSMQRRWQSGLCANGPQ